MSRDSGIHIGSQAAALYLEPDGRKTTRKKNHRLRCQSRGLDPNKGNGGLLIFCTCGNFGISFKSNGKESRNFQKFLT